MSAQRKAALAACEPSAATRRFSCSVALQARGGILLLDYSISGPLQELSIPAQAASPGFTPGLWRHTCCECFLRFEGRREYVEWNFAPSGSWWACAFADYRMPAVRQPEGLRPQRVEAVRGSGCLRLRAAIPCAPVQGLRIGPALVLEHAGGARSHWGLAPRAGRPDFHRPETCAVLLENGRLQTIRETP